MCFRVFVSCAILALASANHIREEQEAVLNLGQPLNNEFDIVKRSLEPLSETEDIKAFPLANDDLLKRIRRQLSFKPLAGDKGIGAQISYNHQFPNGNSLQPNGGVLYNPGSKPSYNAGLNADLLLRNGNRLQPSVGVSLPSGGKPSYNVGIGADLRLRNQNRLQPSVGFSFQRGVKPSFGGGFSYTFG